MTSVALPSLADSLNNSTILIYWSIVASIGQIPAMLSRPLQMLNFELRLCMLYLLALETPCLAGSSGTKAFTHWMQIMLAGRTKAIYVYSGPWLFSGSLRFAHIVTGI